MHASPFSKAALVAQIDASPKAKTFLDYTARDFNADQKVAQCDSTDSLFTAITAMVKNGISSIPVFDSEKNEYAGFLDSLDVVYFINSLNVDGGIVARQIESVIKIRTVLKITNLAKRHPFVALKEDATLIEILEQMKAGASRVPIVDADNKLIKVISQSNIVTHLGLHLHELNSTILKSSVQDGGHLKEVLGVSSKSSTMEAIKLLSLNKSKVSAIAIFDDNGELLSTMTATDVCIAIANSIELDIPVLSFVNATRTNFVFARRHGRDFPGAVVVHPESSIQHVIEKLAATKLHRLFVTSTSSERCIGVVSLKDIVRLLV